jgi:zinc protease
MVEHAGKPFGNGDAMSPTIVPPGVAGADISGAAQIADWRTSLTLLVRLKRQIESEGVTQHEVDEAMARQLALFDVSAVQSASERSPARVNDILGALRMGKTYRSAQQTNDLIKEIAKTLTADKVNAVLREHYKSDAPVLFFAANTEPDGGKAAVDAAFAAANSEPLASFEAVAQKAWPYTGFGKPGAVVMRRTDAATDVTMVRFANGVELNVKPTKYEANAVSFQLRFGYGQIGLPRDAVDGRSFGWAALRLGGYRDLTADEAERALADKKVGVFAGQNEDAYVMTWQPRPADTFDLQMQVLAATFSAPGWRTDDWKSWAAGVADGYASWDSSPASVFGYQSPVLLHGGDQRWLLKKNLITTVKPEDAVAFMKPLIANAPIEINVAGDITVEHAIDAVAKTLGALPPRSTAPEPKGLRDVKMPAPTAEPVVMHHTGPAYQALAVVAWPTTDAFADRMDTHATTVLASVMQDRAFNALRNSEGKTYGPNVSSQFSANLPGYGGLFAMAQVEPQDVEAVFAAFDSIAADIVAHGISDDEFSRAVKPHIEQTERSNQRNAYWVQMMARAQHDPRSLAHAAALTAEFKALTKADVEAAAKKWLVKAKTWRAEVLPEAATANATPAPAPSSAPAQ